MENCRLPFLRSEIISRIRELTGKEFGYGPMQDAEKNRAALKAWRAYIFGIE